MFKLNLRMSFSSISIWPLLNTLPYTLYNIIECKGEYLIKEVKELRFENGQKIMNNLNMAKVKGKELGLLIINKIKKIFFRGVPDPLLKKMVLCGPASSTWPSGVQHHLIWFACTIKVRLTPIRLRRTADKINVSRNI